MIEIYNNNGFLTLETKSKNKVTLDTKDFEVKIDDLNVVYPGEYEKSGILLEVKKYADILFYSLTISGNHVLIITHDKFDLKEEIMSFFGDVDVLIIVGTKEAAKLFESIEARVVVPFGEEKSIFLNTLGQHIEEVDSYKLKSEFSIDSTEFVNLK
ncbi:MAG: hypothetical protein Q8K30_05590 [Candidatus Gracilibacteria bacterium]|nr:hypothetical protein [Candidatus Gracilibacteria bacterium]